MPFARIATVVAVTVLLTLTGCSHDTPRPVAEQESAAPAVPPPTASEAPAPALTRTPPAAPASHRAAPHPAASTRSPGAGSGSAGLDQFVAAVQRKLPDVALDRRDEEVEDLGEQACGALRGGRSATAAAGEISAQGVPAADARTLVGLARTTLCRP